MVRRLLAFVACALFLLGSTVSVQAAAEATSLLPNRVLGKTDAPITVEEMVSFTCSHCADFYNNVMPELEKRYVETGKVRFILHAFPLDGIALKAAALSRCMPEEQFYPFVKILYKSQTQWTASKSPEQALVQMAKLGGLTDEKAKACLADEKLMDNLVKESRVLGQKYGVNATPTFVINEGREKIVGGSKVEEFTAVFDKLLAKKK